MKQMRGGASGNLLKFILLGFMTLAVGGLVFTDVGGFFRGGSLSGSNLAKVGDQTISIARFDRDLRGVLSRIGMSPQEAYERGYTEQFLTESIRNAVVEQSAGEIGIQVDEARAAETIREIMQPGLAQGAPPEQVLGQILRAQNMSERQFVQSIQSQMATQPFIEALQKSAAPTQSMLDNLMAFQQETRAVDYIIFRDDALKTQQKPTEEELLSLYTVGKEQFAVPETRDFQIIAINYKAPEGMSEDDILEETYALSDHIDDLAASGASAEDIAAQTGFKLVPQKPVTAFEAGIDQKILDAVFETQEGEISPVFETSDEKFMAVTVTKITPKTYKEFNDVRADLEKRWLQDRRQMDNKLAVLTLMSEINAGRTTLADIAAKEGKPVQSLQNLKRDGEMQKPFDARNLAPLFQTAPGQAVSLDVDQGTALAVISKAQLGTQPDQTMREKIRTNLVQAGSRENVNMYLEDKRLGMDIRINDRLLREVYGAQDSK